MTLPLSLRLARREMRGGLSGLGIFLACLALGVAAIAGVGSLSAAIEAGLKGDAGLVLGGDVEFHLVNRGATTAQRAALGDGAGPGSAISEIAELRSMARTQDGGKRSLIELKAVDGAYPLTGAVELAPAGALAQALAKRDGEWGAAVDAALLSRLDLRLGDTVRIGDGAFKIRATIAK